MKYRPSLHIRAIAAKESLSNRTNGQITFVTLHGKTYLNDIPLKRPKKTDGERMTNGL